LNRNCGENGYSKALTLLANELDSWTQKFNSIYQQEEGNDEKSKTEVRIAEIDLSSFLQSLNEWDDLLLKASSCIGSIRRESSDIQKTDNDDGTFEKLDKKT